MDVKFVIGIFGRITEYQYRYYINTYFLRYFPSLFCISKWGETQLNVTIVESKFKSVNYHYTWPHNIFVYFLERGEAQIVKFMAQCGTNLAQLNKILFDRKFARGYCNVPYRNTINVPSNATHRQSPEQIAFGPFWKFPYNPCQMAWLIVMGEVSILIDIGKYR